MFKSKYIISSNIRIRYPHLFKIGKYSIVDDFCYISTQFTIGDFFHVASCCVIAGGEKSKFVAGNFGALASGCRIYCASDNFMEDIATILPFPEIKRNLLIGDVVLKDFVTIGANSVVMPNVVIPEGAVIGAKSFVTTNLKLEPWTAYGGYPKLVKLGLRNKESVLKQAEETLKKVKEYEAH